MNALSGWFMLLIIPMIFEYRRRIDASVDDAVVGTVGMRIQIPWSYYGASAYVSIAITCGLLAFNLLTVGLGVFDLWFERNTYWTFFSLVIAAFIWQFLYKPWYFVVGEKGFAWKGRSHRWDRGRAMIRERDKVFVYLPAHPAEIGTTAGDVTISLKLISHAARQDINRYISATFGQTN